VFASKATLSHLFCIPAATDPKEADIIWVSMQVDSEVKKAVGLTDQQYTNQFPFEACLVMKHHPAETIHKVSFSFFCVVRGPCVAYCINLECVEFDNINIGGI
jgi:hypothetical protein